MKTLFLITARGGSKGVPKKNLKEIGGLSVIGWKARSVKAAISYFQAHDYDHYKFEPRLVVSTDCPDIAADAAKHGFEAPFMRPAELASDTASSADVLRHALGELKEEYSSVFLLEPSAPFATPQHYTEAYAKYLATGADLVCGMKETEPHTSFIAERRPGDNIANIVGRMKYGNNDTRRQARAQEWTMNGALYIFNPRVLEDGGDIYSGKCVGYLMDHWHSIEIDGPRDLEMAQYGVDRGYVNLPHVGIMDKTFELIRGMRAGA